MSAPGSSPEPRGLGGWLILLALNIVLLLAASAYLMSWTIPLIRFELRRAATFWAALWPFLRYGPDAVVGIALPIVLLVLFARRHRAFPAVCVTFFALLGVLAIFDQAMLVAANWDVFAKRGLLLADWRAPLI